MVAVVDALQTRVSHLESVGCTSTDGSISNKLLEKPTIKIEIRPECFLPPHQGPRRRSPELQFQVNDDIEFSIAVITFYLAPFAHI